MSSILIEVKDQLGIDPSSESGFDSELIMDINSVLSTLRQLGIGPKDGVSISSANDSWDILQLDNPMLDLVKPYVAIKARLLFDTPMNSYLVDALTRQKDELEFRIHIQQEGFIDG